MCLCPVKERYINLLTDFGFKRLFGTEPNKVLLIDFLNVILPSQHKIRDLSFKNSENLGNTPVDRKAIFDIYCESETGEKFIFNRLFEVAEIANFSTDEQQAYENSLKYYRDLKNVVDTSREEGWEEGRKAGQEEERLLSLQRQRDLASDLLALKLGELPESIQTRINQLALETVDVLVRTIFSLSDLDTLSQWLADHAGDG